MIDKTSTEWLNCECAVCGKKFHVKPSRITRCKNNYCSKECHYEGKKIYMSGDGNHQYGLKGSRNASWKADKRISRYGYIQIRVLDHPFRDKSDFVFEHRLVAEEHLLTDSNSVVVNGKRYLSPDYIVHHKNFDRTDNCVDNLAVMTKTEHQKLHTSLNNNSKDAENGRFVSDSRLFKRISDKIRMPRKIGDNKYLVAANLDTPITLKIGECCEIDTGIVPIPRKGTVSSMFAVGKIGNTNEPLYKSCVNVLGDEWHGTLKAFIKNDTDHDISINPHDEIFLISFQPYLMPDIEVV